MAPSLLQAAHNNATLCATVLAAHGIASRFTPTHWHTLAPPIPLYPAVVTLAPHATGLPTAVGAVKDSFNDLTLPGHAIGIIGDWWRASRSAAPPATPISDLAALNRWRALWSATEDPAAARTFPDALLTDHDLIFAMAGTHSGGLLNRAAGVVGLSNTFGPDPLPALTALAQSHWPGLPVILWQDRAQAPAGWHHLAPMRVWFPDAAN